MSEKDVAQFHNAAANVLNDLRSAFTRPVKMTLIIREPGDEDSEVVILDDEIDAVIDVLQRMKTRQRRGMI